MKRNSIIPAVAFLLILLFAYTATSKLISFNSFRITLRRSPLLFPFANFIAIAIPAIEIIIVLLLVIPVTRIAGLYASAVLLGVFTIYIGYMLLFAEQLPCSCGGVISKLSWGEHVVLNFSFILLTTLGIMLHKSEGRPP